MSAGRWRSARRCRGSRPHGMKYSRTSSRNACRFPTGYVWVLSAATASRRVSVARQVRQPVENRIHRCDHCAAHLRCLVSRLHLFRFGAVCSGAGCQRPERRQQLVSAATRRDQRHSHQARHCLDHRPERRAAPRQGRPATTLSPAAVPIAVQAWSVRGHRPTRVPSANSSGDARRPLPPRAAGDAVVG